MLDNSNPTMNEELYFRIPIMKRKLSLQDRVNNKTEQDLICEAIKDELTNRPDINIQLWLDG